MIANLNLAYFILITNEIQFLFIFSTKRRQWVCNSNCGEAEKTKNGKNYSPRDIETATRLSNEYAK